MRKGSVLAGSDFWGCLVVQQNSCYSQYGDGEMNRAYCVIKLNAIVARNQTCCCLSAVLLVCRSALGRCACHFTFYSPF